MHQPRNEPVPDEGVDVPKVHPQGAMCMVDEDELKAWDGYAGVYMFCRLFNGSVIPMYIGRSKNIYNRIWEHLETTTFMKRLETGPRGAKMLIIGEYIPQSGQSPEKAIAIVEKALIEHA